MKYMDWENMFKDDPGFKEFLDENIGAFINNLGPILKKENEYYMELTKRLNEMGSELDIPTPILTWLMNRVLAKTVAGFVVSISDQDIEMSANIMSVFQQSLNHYIALAC